MTSLLEVHGLVKQFGGHRAVDEASFAVEAGSSTRLIGPNGAGKTTAFNCIAGFLGSDGGRVLFDGQEITGKPPHRIFGLGLTRTFQIPQELSSLSVLENLLLVPEGQTGEPLLRPWRERREEAVNVTRAKEVLALVELTPLMRDRAGSLSGGQQKLLELDEALAKDLNAEERKAAKRAQIWCSLNPKRLDFRFPTTHSLASVAGRSSVTLVTGLTRCWPNSMRLHNFREILRFCFA